MREDDIKGHEECRPMIEAILALNGEIESRIKTIITIGRSIVLPYFSAHRLTFVVKRHTWSISTSEDLPGFIKEVLNKDIGRAFPLGTYLGDIAPKDWLPIECATCLGAKRIRDGETDELRRCLNCGGTGIA